VARKQVGLKFEESDLERWDAFAGVQGLTRTTLVETAVERLISAMSGQAPVEGVLGAGRSHGASPGRRRAYICLHEVKGVRDCVRRVFLTPDEPDRVPDCPEHGAMVRQENRSYLGQATT